MATRSHFIVSHLDGTHSARYHHWDGYPEGLGVFLCDYVSKKEQIDWLLALNRSFSSIMSDNSYLSTSILSRSSENIIHWDPKLFSADLSKKHINTYDDNELILNRGTWEEAQAFCNESYTYLYDEKTTQWGVVLDNQYNAIVNVGVYHNAQRIASTLEENPNFNIKDIQKKLKMKASETKNFFTRWQQMSDEQRTACWDDYAREDFSSSPEKMVTALFENDALIKATKNVAAASKQSKKI